MVVDGDVLGRDHLSDLPVGHAQLAVDVGDDKRHVLAGRGCQRKDRVVLSVGQLEDQSLPDQVLDAVELAVVFPLDRRHLFGNVLLHGPEPNAGKVHVVEHLDPHTLESRERQIQDMIRHQRLLARRVVRRRHRQLQRLVLAMDRQFHINQIK